MSEGLGKAHFFLSLIFINGIFFPMFLQGLAGVSRRLYDGGMQYSHAAPVLHWNSFMSYAAFGLLAAQLFFIVNFFYSIFRGAPAGDNPWDATTLDMAATSSPPMGHGNFVEVPTVYRGPYEYSPPGAEDSFLPQHVAPEEA
jgi:cytochrome c oxidase subunit 1